VYSDPDRNYPHVSLADEAYSLHGVSPAETYLDAGKLIDVARHARVDAVHPGYGFLAENADFVEACTEAGLVFIGPPAEAIRRLGDKTAARQTMRAAGVPVVPGGFAPLANARAAVRIAAEIGYPIALKAVFGGGGMGMRLVQRPDDLAAALRAATSEAQAAFGDGSLYIETLIPRPRHVEVQFLADADGHVVHLGERECSIQRRHQKVIEEAPAPRLTPELRARIGEVAVQAARAVGYANAGTVEFLLDEAASFHFLEVNARLQVEHPVTELVTGLDLVRWQLRLAAGEPLTLKQDDVSWRGHAVECRVYAEDPDNHFLPSSGAIRGLREPAGPGVRVDSGIRAGLAVSPYYDPLLAKLIVWGEDRPAAVERLRRALGEYLLLGPRTNLPLLGFVARHPRFIAGDVDTRFLEQEWRPGAWLDDEIASLAVAASVLAADEASAAAPLSTVAGPAADGSRWRLAARPTADET
jgi:acetyl/propionyl-CoA carboxylase alpha subunit